MKRLKVVGLTLVAVFAMGAVMASAAMASGTWWEKSERLAVGVKRTMTATAATPFVLESASHTTGIECKKIKITSGEAFNETTGVGVDKGKLTFEECKNLKNCENPPATIETLGEKTELGTEVTGPKVGAWVDVFFANASNEFAKFECIVGGIRTLVTVSGKSYACEWDETVAAAETSKTAHSLVCPTRKTEGNICENPITKVKRANGTEEAVELKAFFLEKALFCGTATVEMLNGLTKIEWDVRA